ncbi:MAG: hypothetical protein K9H64_14875 [Bacteroidales bacterium]|nr:hypothetical protein [Bacteroidales bacterium]MCF8457249.1 hypothetical protein [Bacteroidales bacterium]
MVSLICSLVLPSSLSASITLSCSIVTGAIDVGQSQIITFVLQNALKAIWLVSIACPDFSSGVYADTYQPVRQAGLKWF